MCGYICVVSACVWCVCVVSVGVYSVCVGVGVCSLISRPLPDIISQPWRPGNEARVYVYGGMGWV